MNSFKKIIAVTLDILTLLIGIINFLFYIVGFHPKDADISTPTHKIIFLLHGKGFNESQWTLLKLQLRSPHVKVLSCNYAGYFSGAPEDTIDSYAKKCSSLIQLASLKYNCDNIVIVGHSMGGLIAAKCLSDNIKCVITVASPWRGATALKYIGSKHKVYEEMRANSNFLNNLKYDKRIYCIGSQSDIIVGENNYYPNLENVNKTELSWLGHYSIIFTREIHNIIQQQDALGS